MAGDAHAQLAEVIADAFLGKLPKVHESVLAAGYTVPGKASGRNAICKLFGVAPSTVIAWEREGMPVEKVGKTGRGQGAVFDLAAVIQWRCGKLDKALEESGGADSPALERWRAARADTAEIERDLLVESVCKVEWAMRVINMLAGAYFTHTESLMATFVRRFPDAAAEIVRGFEGMVAKVREQLPAKPPAAAAPTDDPE